MSSRTTIRINSLSSTGEGIGTLDGMKVFHDLESERQKIIMKGGQVKSDMMTNDEERKSIVIHLPANFLEKIDAGVTKRVGMNRMAWILQTAQERLEKDIKQQ